MNFANFASLKHNENKNFAFKNNYLMARIFNRDSETELCHSEQAVA